jgi:hypothetical protein
MIRNMLTEMLAGFGLQMENRDTPPPPGVTRVDNHAAMTGIFNADAARQKSNSMFFSNDRRRVVIANNAADLGADPSPRRSDTWLQ